MICKSLKQCHHQDAMMVNNKNAQKLSHALRPFWFVSQLTGITFPSHFLERRLRLVIFYRTIVGSALTLALVNEVPSILFWSRNLNGVHGMLAFIETRLRWFVMLANFLLTTLGNESINNAVNKLKTNTLILKKEEYKNIFKFQIYTMTVSVILLMCYTTIGHDVLWSNIHHKWYTSTIYSATEFYIGFSNIQFATLVYSVKKYFAILNENLTKCDFNPNAGQSDNVVYVVSRDSNRNNITDIVKFRKIYMDLTSFCFEINWCYSLQVLMFLVLSLIEITYSLRAITVFSIHSNVNDVNHWKSKPWLEAVLILFWGGYYSWNILLLVNACENAYLESVKTSIVVHELINKMKDKEVEKQLQLFSMQIMNYKPHFTAGKFIALNFPLINSIFGTITTYLVIIITFTD